MGFDTRSKLLLKTMRKGTDNPEETEMVMAFDSLKDASSSGVLTESVRKFKFINNLLYKEEMLTT